MITMIRYQEGLSYGSRSTARALLRAVTILGALNGSVLSIEVAMVAPYINTNEKIKLTYT
jgi:hypothetical protein